METRCIDAPCDTSTAFITTIIIIIIQKVALGLHIRSLDHSWYSGDSMQYSDVSPAEI